MELEVKENTFYVLLNRHEEPSQMSLFDDLSSSVKKLKDYMRKGLSTDNLELMSVQYEGEQFKISTVPWNIIAMELVKEV